uniref:Uncharacterized protein n=1 Tax=Timema poppense TaxID=170557 RepID=A0A7R9D424_TIMPO|nr:unnamed protein product [Timema poppensis]
MVKKGASIKYIMVRAIKGLFCKVCLRRDAKYHVPKFKDKDKTQTLKMQTEFVLSVIIALCVFLPRVMGQCDQDLDCGEQQETVVMTSVVYRHGARTSVLRALSHEAGSGQNHPPVFVVWRGTAPSDATGRNTSYKTMGPFGGFHTQLTRAVSSRTRTQFRLDARVVLVRKCARIYVERESVKPFLDLPIFGSLFYCESSALEHAATETGHLHLTRHINY